MLTPLQRKLKEITLIAQNNHPELEARLLDIITDVNTMQEDLFQTRTRAGHAIDSLALVNHALSVNSVDCNGTHGNSPHYGIARLVEQASASVDVEALVERVKQIPPLSLPNTLQHAVWLETVIDELRRK